MNELGEHAIVLGASMGGLLAARVLADAYQRVTVVERDPLPDTRHNRRGVPQGRHGHALLPRGAQIIGDLFPGILSDLEKAGVPVIREDVSRLHFSANGHHLYTEGTPERPLPLYIPSRPLLESQVRARLRALPNVDLVEQCDVLGPVTTDDRARVVGTRIQGHDSGAERLLAADLVVDAMGRGARTPTWLASLGYERPREQRVAVGVTYTSVLLRMPAGALREQLVLIGPRPGRPTAFALFGYEDDTWMFTVAGMAGHQPPTGRDQMAEFAKDFVPAHVLAAVRKAEPLTEVVTHRLPASQWRRYDRMRRFPAGLLVIGDAISSFNPLYGQGMSVAALEAEALAACLRGGADDLPRRFFRAAAKPVGVAWQLGTGADLALPEVPGPRPLPLRVGNAVVERYLRAAERDPIVSERFFRVISFMDPPSRLFRPSTVLRVLSNGLRRNRANATADLPELAETPQ